MSVSDPLIQDLKRCAKRFLSAGQPITDECDALAPFCEALERILQQGLLVKIQTFGSWKEPESWHWMERLVHNKYGGVYLYELSVDKVKKCEKVKTDLGRTRLLIRHCLNNRCLHVPFRLLLESQMFKSVYIRNSVLGSEILSQILLSVVLLTSGLHFKLDSDNSRFLDNSWLLPTTKRLTFVPADQLGISLTFVDGKAIAVEVLPDSVASEDDQIELGDVLDELNSVTIVAGQQGCLGQVLKKSGGKPITAYVVKARYKGSVYPPLAPLLRTAGLSLGQILKKSAMDAAENRTEWMTYMGYVLTGDLGDVKEIKRAINQLLNQSCECVRVTIDCHEMGVTTKRYPDNAVVLRHSYMQISSCGCTIQVPNYFAYIAEERDIAPDNRFVCYVFHSENQELVDTTLMSIGQGFKRTHFAV